MLALSGCVPVENVDLDKLLKGDYTGEISSPLPQSGPSADSPGEGRGRTSARCRRSTDSKGMYRKRGLRFLATIPLDVLHLFGEEAAGYSVTFLT